MSSYKYNDANEELFLVLSSRAISALALQLARDAGEKVSSLPTEEQFLRAWQASQRETGWLRSALMQLLAGTGRMQEDDDEKSK